MEHIEKLFKKYDMSYNDITEECVVLLTDLMLKNIIVSADNINDDVVLYYYGAMMDILDKDGCIEYYEKSYLLGNKNACVILGSIHATKCEFYNMVEYYKQIHDDIKSDFDNDNKLLYNNDPYYFSDDIIVEKVDSVHNVSTNLYATAMYNISLMAKHDYNSHMRIKYLCIAAKYGNMQSINKLGNMLYEHDMIDNAIKYYRVCYNLGSSYHIEKICGIYREFRMYNEMWLCYNEAIKNNYYGVNYVIAKYYKDIGDHNLKKMYYMKSLDHKPIAYYKLVKHILMYENDDDPLMIHDDYNNNTKIERILILLNNSKNKNEIEFDLVFCMFIYYLMITQNDVSKLVKNIILEYLNNITERSQYILQNITEFNIDDKIIQEEIDNHCIMCIIKTLNIPKCDYNLEQLPYVAIILEKTSIIPKRNINLYKDIFETTFMISYNKTAKLPKILIRLIAGHLFL